MARKTGIPGKKADSSTVRCQSRRPACRDDAAFSCDVGHSRDLGSAPPTIKLEQAVGFSLYMAKAVLSGRGDEIIELAKKNLFRCESKTMRNSDATQLAVGGKDALETTADLRIRSFGDCL
jgi:hypothetical protein